MPKNGQLLIVDDIQINRMILRDIFEGEYDLLEAENGVIALALIQGNEDTISAILLDMMMPVMDGFEVLKEMERRHWMDKTPVIMITGEDDADKVLQGYSMGISDLVRKPFNADITHRRVNNVVALYAHKKDLEEKLREQREEIESQAERLRQNNLFLIDALSTTVEFRSVESGEHIKRMRLLTRKLLEALNEEYNIPEEQIEAISNASALHDIGKIAIPDSILLKPGKLTDEEFETMKGHTLRGCEILESLDYMQDREYYNYCYEICRHHHERWDGKGYPDGLKGDEISIWAQVTALTDVYEALTSKRVYKDAYTRDEAVQMIINGECGAFNPKLIEGFKRVKDQL